jgi:cobyrinic acid a,c-diamide synthase
MPEETVLASFRQACQGADVALIEGAMGLYDGLDSAGWGSTAHLARLLNVPVILVVNAARMTGSIAAMVMGYQHFQPDVEIAGVILNNVSGSRHERKLTTAVEQYCRIPVVGSIPRDTDLCVRERHLGLIPFPEAEKAGSTVERICRKLEPHLNIDGILNIARSFEVTAAIPLTGFKNKASLAKIGVMLDRVFNFYYPENLEALSRAGADLVFIDSLQDRLPEVDGLYIGGGFPELFLKELVANRSLRSDIANAIEDGLPVYAECAGLMYLCRSIIWQGQRHKMVGIIPAEVDLSVRPQGHGYVEAEVIQKNPYFPIGLTLRGHEFHHSKLSKLGDVKFAYRIRRGHGIDGEVDAIIYKNVFAAYTHLHALSIPEWAESFVSLASKERKSPLTSALRN